MSLISVRNSKSYKFTNNDYVYYNVNITNKNNNNILASFNSTRVDEILDNPSNYELAIVRFSVPSINIPILTLDNTKNFTQSIKYKGQQYTEPVTWINNTNSPEKQNMIWNFQELINSFNLSLSKLYDSLRLDFPADPVLNNNSYWTLSTDTENLVNFNMPDIQILGVDKVDIYMNKQLQSYIPTISYIEDTSQGDTSDFYYKIVVSDNFNNVENNIITMYSESSPLFLWSDFNTIVFISQSIPVSPEFIGTDTQVTRRILTDFQPENSLFDRSDIQYFPQGPLRYYDLKSTQPLRTVDLQVWWEDKLGRLYPLQLAKYDSVSVKIEFRNKRVRNPYIDDQE
jgi:hypothetical protein